MQSLSLGCPVVTKPSTFMRGRHTVSMLEMLDLPELIARDDDDYVDISVRLLADVKFYNDMRQKIVDRNQRLFSDQEVSIAFKKAIEVFCFQSPELGRSSS